MLLSEQFSLKLPTQIIFGLDSIKNNLPEEIMKQGVDKVLCVTDEGLLDTGIIDEITDNLRNNNIKVHLFSEVEPNPVPSAVEKGTEVFNKESCELIIAIGGGSVIDTAKSIAVLSGNSGNIIDYQRGGKTVKGPLPDLFAIPTTAGTGSEVTAVSVLSDPKEKRKFTIASHLIYPKIAFVNPEMTFSLPKSQIAATGLDALVHSIETYTSNKAQPVSDALALQAIKMLREHLPISYSNPHNLEAKSQVMLASTIAGLAFSMSGTALVHSMSRTITSWFGVPHGIANGILLPYVIEYNLIANFDKYSDIAQLFDGELVNMTKYKAANKLVHEIKEFTTYFDIPYDFGYLNIDLNQEIVEGLVKDTLNDRGTLPNNPRKPNKEDLVKLFKKVIP